VFNFSSSKLGPVLKKKTPPAAQTGLKDIYVGVASLHPIGAPYTQVFKPLGLWPSCLFFFKPSSSKLGPALKKKTPPAAQTGLKYIVELAGVEPACKQGSKRLSTCLFCYSVFD